MALSASFSVVGTIDPTALLITDTSTGTDVAVVGRKINIYDVSNALFGASPYDFPNFPATTSITINPLQRDKALLVVVTWINSIGGTVYTASNIAVFTGYAEALYYSLTQEQQAKPSIINDSQYFENKSKFRVLIDSANQAISVGQDIYSAQNCIELYQPMIDNPKIYF